MKDETIQPGDLPGLDQLQAAADAIDAKATQSAAPINAAPPAEEPQTAIIVAQVLAPGFALLAPAWAMQPGEIEQLSEVYGALIDKYFPGGLSNLGPELAALFVSVAILAPRWSMPRKAAAPIEGEGAPPIESTPPAPEKIKHASKHKPGPGIVNAAMT